MNAFDIGTPLRKGRNVPSGKADMPCEGAVLSCAHTLYDLADDIRQMQPEAARHIEKAADLLLAAPVAAPVALRRGITVPGR